MHNYYIVRHYFNDEAFANRITRRGLTLEEAQAHCNDPETSSSTCKSTAALARTKKRGPWFDGYSQEKES